jgi:phage host-nuclease inhibitor protein Gam
MARKASPKRKALQNVPQNREELSSAVARVGSLQRTIKSAKSRADEKIAEIQEALSQEIAEPMDELDDAILGIQAFAESNRELLTEGKTKTVRLPTGVVLWRFTPPRIALKGVENVIALLKQLGLTRFIRTTEDVDKEQMLKERKVAEGIVGVSVVQTEEFVVKPNETDVEVVLKGPKVKPEN